MTIWSQISYNLHGRFTHATFKRRLQIPSFRNSIPAVGIFIANQQLGVFPPLFRLTSTLREKSDDAAMMTSLDDSKVEPKN